MSRPGCKKYVLCCALVALALMSGCASQRISGALERYGVAPEKAECVGDSLSERLSFSQLQALNRAARTYRAIDGTNIPMTLLDLARIAAELRDPSIPIEIVRAGIKCSVLPPGTPANRFMSN